VQGGDAAAAARELDARVAADKQRSWPAPLADFYLGRIDAAQLAAQAGKEPALAKVQTCEAKFMMAKLAGAQGDKRKAQTLNDAWRAECSRPAPKT
jgi:lipoprotein NlpI